MTTISPPVATDPTVITENAAAETTTVAGAQAAVDRGRQYVVLRAITEDADGEQVDGVWHFVGSFDGDKGDDAIRKAVTEAISDGLVDEGEQTYVAIPARSFQPVTLTARTEPKIEFRNRP